MRWSSTTSTSAKVAALVAAGATAAPTAADVARQSLRTITMVETTAQTEEVILGAKGVIAGAARGHIVAMMSTIDPHAAKRIHDRLQEAGIAMLDAPVSGGSARAESGELSVIAGGDAATFAACLPMFKAMSSNQFHVGGIGQGLALKLVNNMLIQVNTVAIAEAFVMGAKAGLDPKVMYDVIKVSTGASFALDHRVPRMICGRFQAGRHRRHFVQGSGAGDGVRQIARRAAVSRQCQPAGLPDGPRARPVEGRRRIDRQGVRADSRA